MTDGEARHKLKGVRGARHHKAKFDPGKVRRVRRLYALGRSLTETAREYKVLPCTIFKIIHLENWGHVQ